MKPYTFSDISKFELVDSVASDLQNRPLLDPNLTIFLTNGYRITSAISFFGKSVEITPWRDSCKKKYAPEVYTMESYTGVPGIMGLSMPRPADRYHEIAPDGVKKPLTQEAFMAHLQKVTSKAVYDFLCQRHQVVYNRFAWAPIRTTAMSPKP